MALWRTRKLRFLSHALVAAALTLLAMAAPLSAADGKRFALVVGNNIYPKLPADKQLANAINDARAVRDTLKGIGFEVLYGENADRGALIELVSDLTARLGKDDTAFFFFAGHGVSFSGANYLLPSDIPAPRGTGRAEEGRLADLAIAETQLVDRITSSGAAVAVMVIDACRDNPLQSSDRRSVGSSRGLQAQPARGVFSIYSASFGQAAIDRLGADDRNPNSLFTRVFIDKLKTPGLDLKQMATETRRQVASLAQAAGQEQIPAYYDQLLGGDVFLAGLAPAAAVVVPAPTIPAPAPAPPPLPPVAALPPPVAAPVAPPSSVALPSVRFTAPPVVPQTPPGSKPAVAGRTLAAVVKRGVLRCGVSQGVDGFSTRDARGNWGGMDVGFCRAVASAIFNDPSKVQFTPLTAANRFTALQAGEVDLLARNTTKTAQREATLGVRFGIPNYYDGQGFMVRKALKVKSAMELSNAVICVLEGTTTELNLASYLRDRKIDYKPSTFATMDDTIKAYEAARCDALAADASFLFATRKKLQRPDDHEVLPEYITREDIAPLVVQGDQQWLDIIVWTQNAMLLGEEFGITQANVESMRGSSNSDIARLLGANSGIRPDLGLSPDWPVRILRHVGNYGELFERSFGKASGLGIERRANALVSQGGLQQSLR